MLLNYYTRKTLTAVGATDAALSAFLQCELWREAFAEADHAANKDRFESIGLLRGPWHMQGARISNNLQDRHSRTPSLHELATIA